MYVAARDCGGLDSSESVRDSAISNATQNNWSKLDIVGLAIMGWDEISYLQNTLDSNFLPRQQLNVISQSL